jgi:transposase
LGDKEVNRSFGVKKTPYLEELLKLLLPELIIDHFAITNTIKEAKSETLRIYLEEKPDLPEEFSGQKLHSRGFYDEIIVQDFPIRGYKVFLHIRRRKWKDLATGRNVHRNWELVAKGTRMTTEFASFLKDINRY